MNRFNNGARTAHPSGCLFEWGEMETETGIRVLCPTLASAADVATVLKLIKIIRCSVIHDVGRQGREYVSGVIRSAVPQPGITHPETRMVQFPIGSEVPVGGDMLSVSRMNGEIRPRFGFNVVSPEAAVSVSDH